ncbi:MAG TPA: flagellin [Bacteriovoracaceae bacterium]|nr:flagellin [Bacteriovoracaceae bacterium]
MRINTNVSSLQAQRSLSEHSRQIESTSGKMSAGTRVRSAADDAASLAIGLKQKSNIRSQYVAIRNANDAVSEFQVAEGSMSEVGNMLTRLRELSVQAATDTLQDEQRGMLNAEYMSLRSEIERTLKTTKFNGNPLLQVKGNATRDFQIGTRGDDNSKLSINQSDLNLSEFNLSIVDSSIPTKEEAQLNLGYIDKAIAKLSSNRALVGAFQNRLTSTVNNLETSRTNESSSFSQNMDTDYAHETSEHLRAKIKHDAATGVLAQANNFGSNALKLLQDS